MSVQLVPAQPGFYGLQFDRVHRKHLQVSIVAWEVFMDGSGTNAATNAIYVGPQLTGHFMSVVTIQSPDGSLYDPLTRTRYVNFNAWLSAQYVNLELNIKGVEQDGLTTFGDVQSLLTKDHSRPIQVQLEDSDIEGRTFLKPVVVATDHEKDSLRTISNVKSFVDKGIPKTIVFLA